MTWTGSHRTVVTVMSQIPLVSLAGGRKVSRTCPTCHRFLTAKLVCWKCCDRLCGVCGKPTGSAFIETCWRCWYQAHGTPGTGEEHPEKAGKAG
jgi:hypothetical protein